MAGLTAGAALGSLAAQVAKAGPAREGAVQLGSHMDYLIRAVAEFRRRTGVDLRHELVTTPDLRTKLVASFTARRSPWDVTFVTATLNQELADRGWVRDLTDRADEYYGGIGRFVKGSFESGRFKGRTYAVPVSIGMPILYFNQRLMERAGLDPKRPVEWHRIRNSWDEFVAYAKAMSRVVDGVQHWGYVDQWGGLGSFLPYRAFVQMWGGDILDQNLEPVFNQEPGVRALQAMVDLLHKHKAIDPGSTTYTWVFDSAPPFLDGRVGMIITWPFVAGLASNPARSKIVGEFWFAPNPAVVTSASVDGSEFLAIPTFARNPDIGWEFIKFATSREMQKVQGTTSAWIPIYEDLLTDSDVVRNQIVAPIVRQAYRYPTKGYFAPDFARIATIVTGQISEALALKKRPKEALDEAVRQIREARKR
jgi:multiple sugar transport system substrate-binding protein